MIKSRLLVSRLLLLVASLAVALLAVDLADKALDLGLSRRISLLRRRIFGRPMHGLGQRDERLGWRPKPNASGTVEEPDFTATYTFGPDGYRIVPGAPADRPIVAFMGGSFTIGTGVNDAEAFPALLQREYWKTYRVRNLGVYAYSTSHVLLQLQEEFEAGHQIHLVAYGWIAHHLFRNYKRRKWLLSLTGWGGKNPLFEIDKGRLVYKGTVGLDEAIDEADPTLIQREWQVTEALLAEINRLCRAAGTRFVLVLLPWQVSIGSRNTNRRIMAVCRSLGVPYLDLTRQKTLTGPENYYPSDRHPKASWHKAVAGLIAQGIDPETGQVRPLTSQ